MKQSVHAELTGDIEGAYVVTEEGGLVIGPDTCWKAILERTARRAAAAEEIAALEAEHGPFLPPDGERWSATPPPSPASTSERRRRRRATRDE